MRLTPDQAQDIRQRIRGHMGKRARIRMLGSRVDDHCGMRRALAESRAPRGRRNCYRGILRPTVHAMRIRHFEATDMPLVSTHAPEP